MEDVSDKADAVGRRAEHSDWLDNAVRFGFVTYGLVHLLIGWLSVQIAFGRQGGSASTKGALKELAKQPLGGALLWLVGVGMALLVGWRLIDLVLGHRGEDRSDAWLGRALDVFSSVVYGVLGYLAVSTAAAGGSSGSGGQSEDKASGRLMAQPFGVWLVGLVGVVIIGYGLYLIWRGLSDKYTEDLAPEGETGPTGSAYLVLGKVGHVGKGTAIALVGGLFCWAALTHDPDKSGGLDAALRTVQEQPYGPVMLSVIAAGIACFGLFCFACARHLSR